MSMKQAIAATLLLLGSSKDLTAQTITYQFEFSGSGSAAGPMHRPHGMAFDSQTDLYVTDWGNSRVLKFDLNGNFLLALQSPPGGFFRPVGVAVNSSDGVFVADTDNHRILRYDTAGNYQSSWGSFGALPGQFNQPDELDFDSQANVYVADRFNNRIQKFDSSGNFLFELTGFHAPVGVAVDLLDNVYVADTLDNRIVKYNSAGTLLRAWGSAGTAAGQFQSPVRIDIDHSNNVFVSDHNGHRVQKFDSTGAYLLEWGTQGGAAGQFTNPVGVTVASNGNIYVSDWSSNRIQIFSDSTALIAYPYCHGESCPCANDDLLAGCRNITGSGATLSASGTSQVGLDDLVLHAQGLPLNNFGLMFMGPDQGHFSFGDGLRCVAGNPLRFNPPLSSGANGTITLGPGIVSYTCTAAGGSSCISAGSVRNFQTWYRDPQGPCGSGFNTTNAIQVTFLP